jgi:hypothetical protein
MLQHPALGATITRKLPLPTLEATTSRRLQSPCLSYNLAHMRLQPLQCPSTCMHKLGSTKPTMHHYIQYIVALIATYTLLLKLHSQQHTYALLFLLYFCTLLQLHLYLDDYLHYSLGYFFICYLL